MFCLFSMCFAIDWPKIKIIPQIQTQLAYQLCPAPAVTFGPVFHLALAS